MSDLPAYAFGLFVTFGLAAVVLLRLHGRSWVAYLSVIGAVWAAGLVVWWGMR